MEAMGAPCKVATLPLPSKRPDVFKARGCLKHRDFPNVNKLGYRTGRARCGVLGAGPAASAGLDNFGGLAARAGRLFSDGSAHTPAHTRRIPGAYPGGPMPRGGRTRKVFIGKTLQASRGSS